MTEKALPIIHDRLIRRPEVERLTGLSRSSIYDMLRAGQFPPSVHLSKRCVAWHESAIQKWIATRISTQGYGPHMTNKKTGGNQGLGHSDGSLTKLSPGNTQAQPSHILGGNRHD